MSLVIFVAFVIFGVWSGGGAAAECTTSGRIANELSEQCRGYTTCIVGGASPIQYHLACPPGFIFHHIDTQCTNVTNYRCLPATTCSDAGSFPDPNTADCSWFVACFPGLSGLSARLVACPPETLFDPKLQLCIDSTQYMCPQASTTTIVTAPVTEPITPPSTSTSTQPNSSSYNIAISLLAYIALSTIVLGVFKRFSCLEIIS